MNVIPYEKSWLCRHTAYTNPSINPSNLSAWNGQIDKWWFWVWIRHPLNYQYAYPRLLIYCVDACYNSPTSWWYLFVSIVRKITNVMQVAMKFPLKDNYITIHCFFSDIFTKKTDKLILFINYCFIIIIPIIIFISNIIFCE